MIIFLYGPDSYRRLKKQQEIVNTFKERHGNLQEEHFDLQDDGEFEKLENFIANRSIFGETKLAVINNLLKSPKEKEIINILKKETNNKDLTLLVSSDSAPTTKVKFLLTKPVQTQHFPELDDTKNIFFINKEAEVRGLKLSSDVIKSIKEAFGSDTWSIITELDKMALTSNRTVPARKKNDYYPLINSIKGGRSVAQRIVALEIILSERRDDPARVFNSLSYKINNKKSAKIFADYDVAVKSGKLDYEEVLVDLVLS